ncbi:MAG TPA: hypothetical protein PK987_10590, partial [Ferruginibacter sp.]|nr:hypothetical protein [Ferruginibacter sp.]
GAINLFMQYKKDAELVGTTTAYGVKSQAANATYRKQIYGSATGNVDLSVPSQFKLTENNSYWIKKEGNMHKFTSKRQFLKICKDKDDEISKFLNTHTIHFNNISNLKELVNYCNDTVYKQ